MSTASDKGMASVENAEAVAFQFTRIVGGQKVRSDKLAGVLDHAAVNEQPWLFVSPHDDDLCIGAGMLIQAAIDAGVDVKVAVVTDGCLGYCREGQEDSIVEIRREETMESFEVLGVNSGSVECLGFPDGGLTQYIGRRKTHNGEAGIAEHIGLQNSLTHILRKHRPSRVFVPTPTDLHPDHRITYSELAISLFHATGAIWPELGPPLLDAPALCELAVYCDFADAPNLEVIGNDAAFDRKLRSIELYKSQVQIGALVESIREAGPYEYIRDVGFNLYSPKRYKSMFAD
ncbi:MAG: GlcNAc-PI de-N-acetylase [Planctomycetaceae bacterium]|nr:GlcNAc-PI de-N-acetylase [Planctomycetaceae bacterium]